MARDRLDLQTKLEEILESKNVYFQPPESFRLKYPCIIYKRSDIEDLYADNLPYHYEVRYDIIVVDSDPDSKIWEKVAFLPKTSFVRHYTADHLNHDVFYIYW